MSATQRSSACVSTGLTERSRPIVDSSAPPVDPDEQDDPKPCVGRTYERWVKVWPGVASTRTRIRGEIWTTSPSSTGTRSKATSSWALTW